MKQTQDTLLLAYLQARGFNKDVELSELYTTALGQTSIRTNRQMQQLIGAYISRINRKIEGDGLAIKPGELKRSYRLTAE